MFFTDVLGLAISKEEGTVHSGADVTVTWSVAAGEDVSCTVEMGGQNMPNVNYDVLTKTGDVIIQGSLLTQIKNYTCTVTCSNAVSSDSGNMVFSVMAPLSELSISTQIPSASFAIYTIVKLTEGHNVDLTIDYGDGTSDMYAISGTVSDYSRQFEHSYDAIGNYSVVVTASNGVQQLTEEKTVAVPGPQQDGCQPPLVEPLPFSDLPSEPTPWQRSQPIEVHITPLIQCEASSSAIFKWQIVKIIGEEETLAIDGTGSRKLRYT